MVIAGEGGAQATPVADCQPRPSAALPKMVKKEAQNGKAHAVPASSAAKGRKKFELPGQTKDLNMDASDSAALKIFYESLYKQKPESEMAQKFLLQHGLLEEVRGPHFERERTRTHKRCSAAT